MKGGEMMKKKLNTSAPSVVADSPEGREATEMFRAQYNKAGLDEESAKTLNQNSGFAEYLLTGIRRFSVKTPPYRLAQLILGVDFITPEEVMKKRKGIAYTDEQITALATNLPPDEVLRWCRSNGYAVMPAPSTEMSVLDIRKIQSAHFSSKVGGEWYSSQRFACEDKTSFGWLAIRKTLVPNSDSKVWNEQVPLLSDLERVPNVAEVVWFVTTYFDVRGIRLFEGIYVRTSSVDSDGNHVRIRFSAGGLNIDLWYDELNTANVGICSIKK